MVELLNVLGTRHPELRLLVRTNVPAWFFDVSARVGLERERCATDVGMVQLDSLRFDVEATARAAADFYAGLDTRADAEAAWLRRQRAGLVVADIPPLAFEAADRSGVPSIAVGNFTWDWIYDAYPQFDTLAPGVVARIRDAYRTATRVLRLPFHGGFAPMEGRVTDIPLIARRSTRERTEARRALGIAGDRPVVLASFGAYGASLPYADALRDHHLRVLTTDRDAPGDAKAVSSDDLVHVAIETMHAQGLGYEDLVAAADVVLTKPGYGIVSEAVANRTAVLYTSRGHFREHDVFVAEMPRWLRVRYLPQPDLLAGRWTQAVEALLAQPEPSERPRVDGAEVAAEAIVAGRGDVRK